MSRTLIIGFLCLLLFPLTAFCCDFDADGIDDPTTYNADTATWKSKLSTDPLNTSVISSFGQAGTGAIPGYYFGPGMPAYYAYLIVDPGTWIFRVSDVKTQTLQFGQNRISYFSGHDFNGDGFTDAAKVVNRCNKLRRSCHRNQTRFNILYNVPAGDKPFADSTQFITALIGNGASPLFIMDSNNDGKDEACFAKPKARKKKFFRAFCKDVANQALVSKFSLGKIFKLPESANINGQDHVILRKNRKKQADTLITIINPNGGKSTHRILANGTMVIADWLGTGSDQIGIATGGVLTIFNPLDESVSAMLIPDGNPVDCNNNLHGKASRVFLNTKNVCKVLNCK